MIHTLSDLSMAQASTLASSLIGDDIGLTVDGASPQRAREGGLDRLSQRMGEQYASLSPQVLPLALARRPLPGAVLAVMDIDPAPLMEAGVMIQDSRGLYDIAGDAIRTSALALLPDRGAAEDRLAVAITRGGMGAERWRDVATHRLRGRQPSRALGPAIQAAVHAARVGHYDEARAWLMAIDPLPRNNADPVYQSLRFELSWCRAQTSLATDMSRIREDLLHQARERAQGELDQAKVMALETQLLVRKGKVDAALRRCQDGAGHAWTNPEQQAKPFALQAARICLNLGLTDPTSELLESTKSLKSQPAHALATAALMMLQGDVMGCLRATRSAIAQAHAPDLAGARARLSLRLGSALMQTGERPDATQAILRAREELRIRGHRADIAQANIRAADLALGRGHVSAARNWLEPVLPIAQSFGLSRVEAEVWRLKLCCATMLGDDDAAREATTRWRSGYRGPAVGWQHAQARWWWAQKKLDEALATIAAPFTPTYAGCRLAIDHAHLLLHTGDRASASRVLSPALEHAEGSGLADLSMLAHLVAGAIAPEDDTTWKELMRSARANPWMELSLMSLAMDGQRSLTLGAKAQARERFTELHERVHHLEAHLMTEIANLGMRRC